MLIGNFRRDRDLHFGEIAPYPNYLNLEVTTRCNLHCVMCPHGLGVMGETRDVGQAVIDSLWPWFEHSQILHLTGIGEPLLAGPFWDILQRLKSQHLTSTKVHIHTNGVLLSDHNIARLLDLPLSIIYFSIDSPDPDTYYRIRGVSLEKVLQGVRRLIKGAQDKGRHDLIFGIVMVLMRENMAQLPQMVRLAADLGIPIVNPQHLVDMGSMQWEVEARDGWRFNYQEQVLWEEWSFADRWMLQAIEEAERHHIRIVGADLLLETRIEEPKRYFSLDAVPGLYSTRCEDADYTLADCPHPWRWLYIKENGNAMPCCYARETVGNILIDGGPGAVWNGPRLRVLRKDLAAGRLNSLCAGASCSYVNRRGKAK